ncbi:hypothetical protein [Sphingomonas panaciterrae]|uniref:hypothetical protein n=1 Tax=Sphingomonas panaciterrae TaxID=1462999 RepID=UPI002FF41EF8
MPATPQRIAFVLEEFRSTTWSDPAVQTMYGKVARDTGDAPIDTYFDDVSAVQAMANERGALLGAHSRAFRTRVDGTLALDFLSALPGARMIDDELVADMDTAVVAIESYDTGTEQTTLATWGTI